MVSIRQRVTQTIAHLQEDELRMVEEYLAFLKFRARTRTESSLDAAKLATLYTEAAEDDVSLAEEGMAEYVEGLRQEDAQ